MPRIHILLQSLCAATLATLIATGCSPVKFSAENKSTRSTPTPSPTPVEPQSKDISCSPRINGSLTSISIVSGAANPTITARCTPTNVYYNWTATRNGSTVAIPGLSGASSTPNFNGLTVGTYDIRLTATAEGWTTYNSPSPLQVTIEAPTSASDVSCDPRLNGNKTSVSVSSTSPSVTVTSSCSPAGASTTWTVRRGTTVVTVPTLIGPSSQPNFYALGAGTYQISLTATYPGYNSYSLTNPLVVTVPNPPDDGRTVTSTHKITLENNKLDILLIIDDSKSMLEDNKRLAQRLNGFVTDLTKQGFDWQMCLTLTRAQQISASDPKLYWGASYIWKDNPSTPKRILKSGTANIVSIFNNTIEAIGAGWAGTDDERAIKAAYWHAWNGEPGVPGSSGCYRPEAGLAVIILSDEDERSVGGDQSQVYYESEKGKHLESDDLPVTYVDRIKALMGTSKRFTVNSIIVRPGDRACMKKQDAEGSKSHFGVHYAQLSNMTQGHVGNICDSDYSSNLNYFTDSIIRSQASIPLQCSPIGGQVTVTATPTRSFTTSIQGNLLVFNPKIPAGTTINLTYRCAN